MKKPIKRVAAIHDMCGIGKAALTNIIPVLSTLGVEVCPIPTMILTTHTGGFEAPAIVKLEEYIGKAFKHYNEININFQGIFIGYLGSIDNADETLSLLKSMREEDSSLIIFDPIFADNGKYYSNFKNDYSEKLKDLIKYSKIITPNFTEACFLSGEEIIKDTVSEEEVLMISRKLHKLGCENVVITSIPVKDKDKIGTSIYNGKDDSIELLIRDRFEKSYPGTGDIFAAVLIGMILKGLDLGKAVKKSCEFVERCIEESSNYDYPTKEGVLLEMVLKELYDL